MDYAVVAVPAAPVRRKARHQSEMVNQLLFGESLAIIKTKGNLWAKIRSLHDGYEGWLTNTLLKEINEQQAKTIREYVTTGILNKIIVDEKKMIIPSGSSLPE